MSKNKVLMSNMIRSDMFGASLDLPRIIELDLNDIHPNPDQPRKYFNEDALCDLAQSIEEKGLLQPILVKRNEQNGYLLVAGERRFRAHQILNKTSIAAIITEGNTDEIALIENLQREELLPMESAEALNILMLTHGYTQEEVATSIGKARNTIAELLSLNKLPELIRQECRTSDIVSKSVLIELSKMPSQDALNIWESVKLGKITVKEIRSFRTENKKSARAIPVSVCNNFIRSIHKNMDSLNKHESDITQEEYKELLTLKAKIDKLLEGKSIAD